MEASVKTIGMIGGMSWESTASYYKFINEGVRERLGGFHSAKICLYSVDFSEIERLQYAGQWDETAEILCGAAKSVEAGGADFLILCTNTMHRVADEIENSVRIPLLHIADATADELLADGVKTVGLLGTQFTMEHDFYRGRLQEKYRIQVLTPNAADRRLVHNVIYSELCLGRVSEMSRAEYIRIIAELNARGAQAVILGCTEIALLVQQRHMEVPLYDTTAIHARKAVEIGLAA